MAFDYKRVPTALAVTALLALPALAAADNTVADGDGVVPYADNNMAFGSVGCNVAVSRSAAVAVSRSGNATGTNTFRSGATVTVAIEAIAGSGLSATVPADARTITLPGNWSGLNNGALSSAVSSSVRLSSSVEGAGSGSVTYSATGLNSDGNSITRLDTMNVSWNTGSCAPADETAPSITPGIQGTLGDNDWYTSNVELSWDVADGESAISSRTGCGSTTITTDTGGQTFTCTATSAGGTASRSVTIKRDASAPAGVGTTLNRVADHNGWHNAPVGWATSGTDTMSGIAACDGGTYGGPDGNGLTVSGRCTDNAGNRSALTASAAFDFDDTNPTLSPSVNPDPVILNGSATASANATDATSGVAGQSCDAVATSAVGPRSVACRAGDEAGNLSSSSASYSVVYAFTGFFQPIDMNGVFNKAKAGSTIPVKFSLGGDQGLGILANAPSSSQVACPSSTTVVDAIEEYTTATSGLKYDAVSDQYVYNWKTDGAWAGKCRQLIVKLNDGSTARTANFAFMK